jgi:phage pi2 protein 07
MTTDEIKGFIEANFAGIVSEPRSNPDGWAFYYKEVRRGANSGRVARAVQSSGSSPVLFKLAASARLNPNEDAVIVDPDEGQVRELFERELKLWMEHYQ